MSHTIMNYEEHVDKINQIIHDDIDFYQSFMDAIKRHLMTREDKSCCVKAIDIYHAVESVWCALVNLTCIVDE